MSPFNANIPIIKFNGLPDSQTMEVYRDRLIVYDNINIPLSESYTDNIKAFLDMLPMKLEFTIAIFCLEGHMDISCNLQKYSIAPGEIFVAVPGTIGESVSLAPDSRLIVLSVSDNSYCPAGTLKKKLFAGANFIRPIKFSVSQDIIWPIVQTYQHLKRAISDKHHASDELVSSYMMVLASYAAISLEEWAKSNAVSSAANVTSNKLYNDFLDLLEMNFIEHKNVAFYAEACKLSPKYFAKQILKVSGRHPLEWIREHVVLNAQALLRSGEYTISQVCEKLKFSSAPAFNRYFKDVTGITPSEYLKN